MQQVTPPGFIIPDWSPTGDKIAYFTDTGSPQTIRLSRLDGSNVTEINLPFFIRDLKWSPQGNKLAVISDQNTSSQGDIFVMSTDGSDVAQITNHPSLESGVDWSPDGSRLVFARQSQIWTIQADGTNEVQLTTGTDKAEPLWSPDGHSIVYATGVPVLMQSELRIMSADGSERSQCVGLPRMEDGGELLATSVCCCWGFG